MHPHTGHPRHLSSVERQGYSQSISVPDQLINMIARRLVDLLPAMMHKKKPQQQQQHHEKQRQQQHMSVQSISTAAAADHDDDTDIEIDVNNDGDANEDTDDDDDGAAFQVDYIQQAVVKHGVLMLEVFWVGYTVPTWEPASLLEAHLSDYDYATPAWRAHALALHRQVQQQQHCYPVQQNRDRR